MQNRDKPILTMSLGRAGLALFLFLGLALLGCGTDKGRPVKHDAGSPDLGPAGPSGPEAGPESASVPRDPASCAAAVSAGDCDPAVPSASIRSAAGGPLLASVTVREGACLGSTCVGGCDSLDVRGVGGSTTCTLLVTAVDGRTQIVQLTTAPNPSQFFACCDVMGKPSWVSLNPLTFVPGGAVVEFPTADGGLSPRDGNADETPTLDTPLADASGVETGDVPASKDVAPDFSLVIPTDPESCAAATGVPHCDPAVPMALVRSAPSGPLLASVSVSAGACAGSTCASGCESLTVTSTVSQIGETCDLLVTLRDGSQHAVQLTLTSNPSPRYACCGYALNPNRGTWLPLDPLVLSPGFVLVGPAVDGGTVVVDGGGPIDAPGGG
jgi:hypothetical protein